MPRKRELKEEDKRSDSKDSTKGNVGFDPNDVYFTNNKGKKNIEIQLTKENYDWVKAYCDVNSERVISFQDFLQSEFNKYFSAFFTGRHFQLTLDTHLWTKELFGKNESNNIITTAITKQSVKIEVFLYKNCYYWLLMFCHLVNFDFEVFINYEINTYFKRFYSDIKPTFRDAFFQLKRELNDLVERKRKEKSENESVNLSHISDSYESTLAKYGNMILVEFHLERKNYEWFTEYHRSKSSPVPFQNSMENEIIQFFCAFSSGEELGLRGKSIAKERAILEKHIKTHFDDNKDYNSISLPNNTFLTLNYIPTKIYIFKKCYYWLETFCHLLQINLNAFISKEINAHFQGIYSEKIPTFRDSFFRIKKELDEINWRKVHC